MRLDNDKFLTLFLISCIYKGLEPAPSGEQQQSQRGSRPMSFVNPPGDDERGTEFSQSNPQQATIVEVTTPRKKKKGKKGSSTAPSSGTKKKKKRKRASPKKTNSNSNDEGSNPEEVMSKLMAVKQLQKQPMLIGKAMF